MIRLWEHVERLGRDEAVATADQSARVAGQCGWVARDVDDARGGEAEEVLDDGFVATGARRIEKHFDRVKG